MDANWWLWIVVIALVAFCFVPMLLMGRRGKGREAPREQQTRESERREGGAR